MKDLIANTWRWVCSVGRWLREAWLFWLTLVVLGLCALPVLYRRSEPSVRIAGTALQVLGTLVVAVDIWRALQDFGRPNYIQRFAGWLTRFPRWKPRVMSISGTLRGGSSSMSGGRLTAWHGVSDPENIKGRLSALEANLGTVRQHVEESDARLTSSLSVLKSEVEAERVARESGDSALHSKLEAIRLDGLDWAAAGFVWVIVGTVVAGLSTELAAWLGR